MQDDDCVFSLSLSILRAPSSSYLVDGDPSKYGFKLSSEFIILLNNSKCFRVLFCVDIGSMSMSFLYLSSACYNINRFKFGKTRKGFSFHFETQTLLVICVK